MMALSFEQAVPAGVVGALRATPGSSTRSPWTASDVHGPTLSRPALGPVRAALVVSQAGAAFTACAGPPRRLWYLKQL